MRAGEQLAGSRRSAATLNNCLIRIVTSGGPLSSWMTRNRRWRGDREKRYNVEFRDYYRGVCAKIRFDYITRTYIGELDGLPTASFIQADSFEQTQASLRQAVDDHFSSRSDASDDWDRIVELEKAREEKEAREAEQAEEPEADPFQRRQFLR